MGYLLLALVLFTLKDAAKRGRLGASTFRELNIGGWVGWFRGGCWSEGAGCGAAGPAVAWQAVWLGLPRLPLARLPPLPAATWHGC